VAIAVASIDVPPEGPLDLSCVWRNPIVERAAERARRRSESERVLKAAAKQLAKQVGDLIDDRRSREACRIQVYNAVAPFLLELRDRHELAAKRVRHAWFASIAVGGIAVLVGYLL
jgi:hypothetical protein